MTDTEEQVRSWYRDYAAIGARPRPDPDDLTVGTSDVDVIEMTTGGVRVAITAEQMADPERLRRAIDIGWAATGVTASAHFAGVRIDPYLPLCGDPGCTCGTSG